MPSKQKGVRAVASSVKFKSNRIVSESLEKQHEVVNVNAESGTADPALRSLLKIAVMECSSPTADRRQPQSNLRTFGKYELVWQLSRDALSTTYAARTEGIDALLAVRIFNERVRSDAQVKQIQKAAKSAAEITHPHAVVVYESGVGEDGSPYIVTDWIEGEDLSQVLQVSKRLDIARFLNVFCQVCEALSESHSRQLIHGNLSPYKIIFAENEEQLDLIKVTDFGMPPDPLQNAFYMSPEQSLDRAKVDARSDIYSLGCIMHEALVGNPPFVGHKKSQAALNYLHELANQYSPDSPEHKALKLLDCIIIKCLQTDRRMRFANVHELADALRLVSDCICAGSTRKLPHKAEKLLLFRFLDLFDKKIVACMFAYLILGLGSMKFLAELQLQKYIDGAQLAVMAGNWPLAQSNWKLAIKQAQWANKPPSLQADLHWELADTYSHQRTCFPIYGLAKTRVSAEAVNNELAKDAIREWHQALKYFEHGAHLKSCALMLWQNIGHGWLALDSVEQKENERMVTRRSAQALLDRRKLEDCVKLCSSYLMGNDDVQIATLAVKANMELAKKPTLKNADVFAGRAAYFRFFRDGAGNPDLNAYLDRPKHGDWPTSCQRLGISALEKGDLQAAGGLYRYYGYYNNATESLYKFYSLEKATYQELPHKDSNLTHGIEALEKALNLAEEANGKHSNALVPTLVRLAQCYVVSEDHHTAIETYKKIFALTVSGESCYDSAALQYVSLLTERGDGRLAVRFLEKRLRLTDGSLDTQNGLYARLIKAYADTKAVHEAHEAVLKLIDQPEAEVASVSEPVLGTIPGYLSQNLPRSSMPEPTTAFFQAPVKPQSTQAPADELQAQTAQSDSSKDESGF